MINPYEVPLYSPKYRAYMFVMSKIHDLKLKSRFYPDEYTRQVNLEIDGIRKRLNAAAHRAGRNEVIRKKCEKDPQFAARWKRVKLESAYINTFKRQRKLDDQIAKLLSDQSVESDPSDNSGGGHAGQD